MIGDPKQSIYSFRGADVYSYLEAREDVAEEKRIRLDRNIRSTLDPRRGLNILWGRQDDPFVVYDIDYQQVRWGREEACYDELLERGQEAAPIRFQRGSKSGQDRLNKKE